MNNQNISREALPKCRLWVEMAVTLEEQWPQEIFTQVHKSFIVNRNQIKSIEGNILHINNERITISQNLKDKVLNEILKDKIVKR